MGFEPAGLEVKVSARAKVMRLRVDARTGRVLLTVPRRVSRRKALQWAAGHSEWVEAQLALVRPPERLGPGSIVPLFDAPHVIDWSEGRSRLVELAERRLLVGGPLETIEARVLRWLRRSALDLLSAETAEFAAKAEVRVARVSVGDPISRWGSCSAAGAIRYSWRLILAPDWVRRATVAHEVAHRVHMHHGRDFHALVERLLGADPKPARLWLRRSGPFLHRIGVR